MPHPIGQVHRSVRESALVDELQIDAQIGRHGWLGGTDHHRVDREEHVVHHACHARLVALALASAGVTR